MKKFLSPLVICVVLITVYAFTIAPGLTWANRGADGGDLITAATTGGVAHPTGYPTYLALARLFQFLPWGTLAFRTNILSALCAVLAAVIVAKLAESNYSGQSEYIRPIVGLVAGLGYGLSPLFWSQAIITEVYTLQMLFMALILYYLPLIANQRRLLSRVWVDRLSGLLFGLALGNQFTVVFLLPPWLLVSALIEQPHLELAQNPNISKISRSSKLIRVPKFQSSVLFRRVAWLLIGLLIYATIPLRARHGSPVSWGDPQNLNNLWWLVSGQLYQDRVFTLAPEFILPRIRAWAALLGTQFGFLGLVLGIYGIFYGKPRSKQFFWTTGWIFIVYSVFSIGYNSSDSYALLLPVFMAFALWLGLGAATMLKFIQQSSWTNWAIPLTVVLLLLNIGINAGIRYKTVDAHADQQAEDFVLQVFTRAPHNSIIIAEEDRDTFSLWYYHFALGQRSDLIILNRGLLSFDWYRDIMRKTYPGLVLSDQADCSSCTTEHLVNDKNAGVCETHLEQSEILTCLP